MNVILVVIGIVSNPRKNLWIQEQTRKKQESRLVFFLDFFFFFVVVVAL